MHNICDDHQTDNFHFQHDKQQQEKEEGREVTSASWLCVTRERNGKIIEKWSEFFRSCHILSPQTCTEVADYFATTTSFDKIRIVN